MDFVSQWRRRILAAAGAGMAVPVVILGVALIVGIGGGGIAGLGALSQALTGPAVPDADASVLERERRTRPAEETGDLLAQVRPAPPARAGTARSPGAGSGGERSGGRPRAGREPGERTIEPVRTPQPGSGTPADPGPGSGAQPTPEPPPGEPPGVLRQTGEQVADAVEGVPVVGPTGAEVVRQTVQTVDEILPLPLTTGR